jgi:Tol biopolymer transport system component
MVAVEPAISADGRYVAFASVAANLVPGDTNSFDDVFVHDRVTGATVRASVTHAGAQADWPSNKPSISADGLTVAFVSDATNLVPGDTNLRRDVFVRDLQAGFTTRASVSSSGAQANEPSFRCAISGDGRFVAFESYATNLVLGDTNGKLDVFVHDRQTGATLRASVASSSAQANADSYTPSISADGRYVAFASLATNLVAFDKNGAPDVFVRDLQTSITTRVSVRADGSQAAGLSVAPSISADGRFVAFESAAPDLVAGDRSRVRDVFVHDRQSATTTRASVATDGAEGGGTSWSPSISGDGSVVAFASASSNLVAGDANAAYDVFARDRTGSGIASYCTAKVNSAGCTPAIGATGTPSASAGAGFVVTAEQVLDLDAGLLLYGVAGSKAAPFQGGYLCVRAPLARTPVQTAGGNGLPPCVGTYALDFNAWIAGGADPALGAGRQVWAQYWTRDALAPSTTGLTDALTFVIGA